MANVITLLPFLRGWEWVGQVENKLLDPIVLNPGDERILSESERPGWFVHGGILVDNQYAELILEADRSKFKFTPYGLRNAGLTRPWEGAFISRYDTENNLFAVSHAPVQWFPYREKSRLILRNPEVTILGGASTTCKLYQYFSTRVEIVDVGAFIESLKEVVGVRPKALVEVMR